MTRIRVMLAVFVGASALGMPAAAIAGPVASTPDFKGGTPRIQTGMPSAPSTPAAPAAPAVKPTIKLTGALDAPKPHVAVDDAGTAYVTWLLSTSPASEMEGAIGFCRLPRGASACTNPTSTQVLRPQKQSYNSGDSRSFNQDALSGAYPLVLGDQLFILSTRGVTTYETPAGESTATTIAFASTDAGDTFSGAIPVAGGLEIAARPVAFGADDNPLIGLLGPSPGSMGEHAVEFQAISGGAYASDGFRLGTRDGGALASERPDSLAPLPNGGIAASYSDARNVSASPDAAFVRTFAGPGSPAGSAAFSAPRRFAFGGIDGEDPDERSSLAYGPKGLVIGTIGSGAANLDGLPIVTPVDGGAPIKLQDDSAESLELATAGTTPGGQIIASYEDTPNPLVKEEEGLYVRRSTDGTTFTPPERLTTTSNGITTSDLAAAPDGGGFVVMTQRTLNDEGGDGEVRLASFGPQAKSTLPGLPGTIPGAGSGPAGGGSVDGGGVDDGVTRECSRIAVGVLQITTDDGVGCFLPGVGKSKGKSASNGPVLYNGLRITPLGGGQIVIDIDKSAKTVTFYSTKEATVEIPSETGDIKIFQGQLKQTLSAKEGAPFLDLDPFPATVKGFRIANTLKPLAQKGGARIPVDLDLGPQFFNLTAHGELLVDPAKGLVLESLRIGAKDLVLGPVTVKELEVSWMRDGNRWSGKGAVVLANGAELAIDASFDSTSFTANASYTLPFPGVQLPPPAPPIVYLYNLSAGLDVNRNKVPLVVRGGAKVGVVPLSPNPRLYALDFSGQLTLTFADPFVVEVRGTLEILSTIPVATASVRAGTDGIVKGTLVVEIGDKDYAYLGLDAAFAAGPPGFEAKGKIEGCLGIKLVSVCKSATGFGSTRGLAGCADFAGDTYTISKQWKGKFKRFKGSCYFDEVSVGLLRSASGAQVRQVAVPSGAKNLSLNVFSADGVPRIAVIDPTGAAVDANAPNVSVAASASNNSVVVDIDDPKPGQYRVMTRPGSPAVTEVAGGVPAPDPVLSARLGKKGAKRTITYEVTKNPDVRVTFLDSSRRGAVPLNAPGRKGTVRFTPNVRTAGKHVITARFVNQEGTVVAEKTVGSYEQPVPPKPRAAKSLRVTKVGSRLKVAIKRSGMRTAFVVDVRYGGGGRATARIPVTRSSVTVAGPAPSLENPGATKITVRPYSAAGRYGPRKTRSIAARGLQAGPVKRKRRPTSRPGGGIGGGQNCTARSCPSTGAG